MMKKILLFLMALAFVLPAAIAGEKTVTISRNEGIYDDGTGVYYCSKGGITMTFSSGLNNVNYLVEHQQVVFDIFSTNYVIKKIKFNCLDNTTDDNLDCFYWGPSTISEFTGAPYTPTGTYTYSGYIGTWVGGSTPSKYIKFVTEGKPVRFGSVEITIDKEYGDIYDLVRYNTEIQNGQTYALVSKYDSRALGKEEFHGDDPVMTFSSTPVTLLNFDETLNNYLKVKVTDEVSLMKLESSGNSDRPWYIKIGDNYLRRRTGTMQGSGGAANGQGWNIFTVSSIPSGSESYFRTRITVENNNNALIRYSHTSSETSNNETFAIRHYNGGDLFRVIDYNTSNNQYANNQRVYLYKPAEPYIITTECLPSANDGYITLSDGVLLDNQGNQTSQMGETVKFFVGPTNGWGVGTVTVTNLTTNEVTTLTPTSTSDFGNDYQFPMPGANVHVTANFLPPYDIHTVSNPADGGDFNFTNGYTDFNGQTMSNEGKTVTFEVVPADGYILNSVTYTDDVTGQTTTLTPDGNGVYTFVMPGNSVTLTANYEEANDLYLLGTANGETAWHPYGPKFIFDGENQVYYIDVYFKGDSLYNYGAGDPYGHFSLSRVISNNPDESAGWGEISGHRIFATSPDYWVQDGITYYNCFQTYTDQAFKIPAGVYRITVSKDLDKMSIAEYKPTLVFTPAGGDPNNPTVVDLNTEVVITSNLEQLVHDINPNEPSHATFYNTADNWATNEHDNTRVISNYDVTTIIANVNLGYIKKEDNASYEVISDLYLLGTANGMNSWQPYGPQFTYDSNTETYSLDVYFTGLNVTAADEGYGYFSLTKVISNPANPNWGDIPSSARINAEYNDVPITGLNYNESTTKSLYQTNPDWCFKIDPGVYTITVNRNKTEMTVTKHELTLTFNPVSGTTVAAGDNVNISSNLEQLVHAINPDEPLHATIMYATSTDGTLLTPDTEGSTVTITAVDATTTVNAEATLGYITVPGNAYYIVPAPTVYSITTQVNPEGSNAGTITAPSGSVADATVNFTVTDTDASVYTLTGVEVVDSNNGIVATFEPSADGNYSFTMPSDDVTIHADYVRTPYNVTTSWSPSEGGAIWLNNVNVPQTVSVANGSDVVFGVSPATESGYRLTSLVVMNETTGQEITPTSSGSNEYTFTMPTGNVTITAQFDNQYNIYTECVPEGAGDFIFYTANNHKAAPGDHVYFTVSAHAGYRLDKVTLTYVDENNETHTTVLQREEGEYGFNMPAADVTITAEFIKTYQIFTQCIPEEGGRINNMPTYAAAGDHVTFTLTRNNGYAIGDVTMSYVDENDEIQTIAVERNGAYCSFDMPAADVTVTATFNVVYTITKQCTPPEGGTINLSSFNAIAGRSISFTVTSNAGYALTDVTISYVDENDVSQIITLTPGENGTYNFIMPSANVTINANFAHIPYGISTVCEPTEGGTISVASSAYTGDRVDFTVEKTPGYQVSSVTVTNDVTGQVISSYQGQDGQYHFTMPDAAVTITANFSPVGDLYLLGTYNGNTEWDPNGLKFDYDITNDEYSLTVYFKGIRDVAGQDDNRQGFFNLTTAVHESDWDYVNPYRLVPNRAYKNVNVTQLPMYPDEAVETLYAVADGYEPTNQFAIPAGVYTITVTGDKRAMTVTKVPVTVTLTISPEGAQFDGSSKIFVTYGTVVTATSDLEQIVHAINPNEDNATFSMERKEYIDNILVGSTETVSGNQTTITYEGMTGVTGKAYIGWIDPYESELYFYHNLHYLEAAQSSTAKSYQFVCDTLVGVWAAERVLWAKDLGGNPVFKDLNEHNLLDYGIDVVHMQDAERGWDKSNWVMLDFTDYLEGYNDDDALAVLNKYVNKELKPLSVKGYFTPDLTYRIKVMEEPRELRETIGYPGYLQDPRELLAREPAEGAEPEIYYYNHYTPCNFMCSNEIPYGPASGMMPPEPENDDWSEIEAWVKSHEEFAAVHDYDWSDPWNWTEDQWATFDELFTEWYDQHAFFFIKAKPSEVAHVWGVWRGDDVFDVYEMGYDDEGNTVNFADLYGAFKVGGWEYNRLTPTPAYYGRPEGEESLHENVAYEFHIAIKVPGDMNVPEKKLRKSPVAKGCDPMEDDYLIYPLDLMGHSNNVTHIPENVTTSADKTVQSVRYYNIMGQESKEPFSGVNIVVTRYTDGSISTAKVLR